jgi:two-component system phosphate regulon sensor histidine kinase PhoR
MRWRITFHFILLIVLSMAGLTLFLSNLVKNVYLSNQEAQLAAEARLLATELEPFFARGESGQVLNPLAQLYADTLNARVTLIAIDGVVLGDSHADWAQMDNHLYRPEVQEALSKGQGSRIRYSNTIGYDMMYVAVPITVEGQPGGIVRTSLSLESIQSNVTQLRRVILVASLIMTLLAGLLAFILVGRMVRPIRQLQGVAERMASGDLNARLFPTREDEVGQLTGSFNRMADNLQAQMTTLVRERSRLAAVLSHMADGVLITDGIGNVLQMNPAAERLTNSSQQEALGQSYARVVRHHRLIELWKRCHESGREQSEVVEMTRGGLFLQAIVTPFQEVGGWGFLVILQDLTRIKQLETVRRDFISNISHELRTPLASLKALVDTLRDGALEDPPAARRFLDRVEIEVDALTQIVQELLELSRVESGQVPLDRQEHHIHELILLSVERLRPQAQRAGLELVLDMSGDCPLVLIDADRVRQVLTNLLHNAIKFTAPGGRVRVWTKQVGAEVVVAISDTGVGIASDDLPRIFERFFKADRARSGGGTGLGLAIAKHIVQAHGGRIWAESVEGKGSTFYFSLPCQMET